MTIYLDNAATKKVDEKVLKAIMYTMENIYGNPSSVHSVGRLASKVVERARNTVANFINAKPEEIIFTSGACEANSLALSQYGVLITTKIEHKSIMELAKNTTTIWVDVDKYGLVDVESLKRAIRSAMQYYYMPILSVQFANNEIGTVQDIKEIVKIAREIEPEIVIHTDATQIMADRKIDVKDLGVDMLSFSGQKIGTPKGIGVLYVREGIDITPLIYGSQENGRRGGTENVPYIAGLECAINNIEYNDRTIRKSFVNEMFARYLSNDIDYKVVYSGYGNLKSLVAMMFPGIDSQGLMALLDEDGICVGSGSACNTGSSEPSYVLKAIGLSDEEANSVIRFSFSNDITEDDIEYIVDCIEKNVKNLKLLGIK